MKRNLNYVMASGLSVAYIWVLNALTVFAAEGESLTAVPATINQASVITQSGSLYVIGYIAVGIAMAGFGFTMRKKI